MEHYRDEWLLLRTLDDLQERILSNDEYDLLISSLLLRKLLMDGHPLMNIVNRRHHLKIAFDICEPPAVAPDIGLWSFIEGFDPTNYLRRHPGLVTVSLDSFLATVIMIVAGKAYSVKALIDQVAYVDGGVHLDESVTGERKLLAGARDQFFVMGIAVTQHPLTVIGRIVLRALEPLRHVILAAKPITR
jgi:hypothetical protein